jgi:hypothetical protein
MYVFLRVYRIGPKSRPIGQVLEMVGEKLKKEQKRDRA